MHIYAYNIYVCIYIYAYIHKYIYQIDGFREIKNNKEKNLRGGETNLEDKIQKKLGFERQEVRFYVYILCNYMYVFRNVCTNIHILFYI
jgi:hypothetical protein